MNSFYAEREIRPGESVSFDLDITHYYGDLPDGEYRVIYNTETEDIMISGSESFL